MSNDGHLVARFSALLQRLLKSGLNLLVGRFVIVGASCSLGYLVIASVLAALGVATWLASGATYVAFIPVAYLLQRGYTFRSTARHAQALPRYIVIQALGALVSILLPYLLSGYDFLPPAVVFIAVLVTVAVFSFVLMSVWAFRTVGEKG